nr:PREDICTED: zinc finger protein 385C isoform X1 [Paralichthys olivaceus]XP_019949847.1 PREDICTED: zinc finger protein 385C isoform X1 [Paralichthys olivaceus]XP_019949848.1 PREDICTED: zinc finger protein 385C isoform X1 [Paralichthys olivaceus]XP_019949849.1 PREDICTED: zinc finger protein 385C isoform X1 [Paralichthys olivaceus]XP_019949850.1 PREDICTED: zinc finger protein 385C isoform X1 [Paralichthys olivaceus]
MKRPFSPSALPNTDLDRRGFGAVLGGQMDVEPCCETQDEGAVPDEHSPGGALPAALCRPKRERKLRSYTLCEVCNIQLNSAAQAQIHYNGKSHQKRLKQISNGKMPSTTGTSAQGSSLLASLPIPGRPLQPQLDLKHLLPFRLNGSSPLSLFPNFNTMDPVQKAVINHTFGVPQPLKKKQIISCNICHLRFNSTNQAEAHYKGHKHARKLKAMEAQKNRQRRSGEASFAGRERDRDRERDRSKTTSEATLPALMDTSLLEGTGLQADLEPANLEVKLEESPRSSAMLTPVSEVSSVDLVTLSPPQISPSSQLSETASDTSATEALEAPEAPEATEASGLTAESCSHADTSSTNGETNTDEDKEPKKSKAHLHCPVCKVTVNSISQLEAHNSGTKHKLMLEGQSVVPRRRGKVVAARAGCKSKRLGSKGSIGVPSKNFQCEVCEIFVNSETQLSQHMNSRRHKDRLAGKPPKPKFTPHSKSQPSSSLANMRWSGYAGVAVSAMKKAFSQYNLTSLSSLSSQTKLALQKQLTKSLTTGFLPSPLTPPTLCTVATNPLALRHPMGATTFIQTPFLGPALFRPAPGPLRATHTPIIFSPY